MCKPWINYVCSMILEQLQKEETGFSWCTMADMDAEPCQSEKSRQWESWEWKEVDIP